MTKPKDMITTKEAAFRLGVSQARVRAMIAAGQLDARKIGNSWAIEPKALNAVKDRKAGRPLGPAKKKPAARGGRPI